MVRFRTIFLILSLSTNLYAYWYYPAYFYMPEPFFGEPRFAKKWLTTLDVRLRGGHATRGYTDVGCDTRPIDIYGLQNMHAIAKNVPACILQCAPHGYLNNLWQNTPASNLFGRLGFEGKCSLVEFFPTFVQNFSHGFFVGTCIPIKKISMRNVMAIDLTDPSSVGANLSLSDWQQFFGRFDQNLCRYGIYPRALHSGGLGDIMLFGGWTINYEDMDVLDFLDGTLTLGLQLPTAPCAPAQCPFMLPRGSNGHKGISLCATGALGALDWLTVGLQVGVLQFLSTQRVIAIKTAYEQSGWIKLARMCATVSPGLQWRIGEFFKFDHLAYGLSFTFGFSHTHQGATNVCQNTDPQWWSWRMNTFHFVLECDFATFKHPHAPHVAMTIDHVFNGKRTFNTSLFGTIIAWDL